MDFSKILDYVTPQGLKDIIKNLQSRISALIDQNENLYGESEKNKKRIQELEDQIRILKGEKPLPKFTESKDVTSDENKTTDENKKKKKDRSPRRKKIDLSIDKTINLKVDRSTLPSGAIHKGYRQITIQDILFERHNICFNIERFYDPTTGKLIEADIPAQYKGHEFGPTLRSFIVAQYFESDCTHSKIKNLLTGIDIDISKSQINNILLKSSELFKDELSDLREAALMKDPHQHIDDTSWKILKRNSIYTIVTGNSYFTQFATVASKSRYFAIYALSGKKEPKYRLDDIAIDYVIATKNSVRLREFLIKKKSDKLYNETELKKFFGEEDFKSISFAALHDLRTGMYLAAFRAGDLGYNGTSLMSDDAGQFNYIYADHGLCWIHELRHYKLIEAFYGENKIKLNNFLTSAWNLFRLIKSVRVNLNSERAAIVLESFEKVFGGAKTGFKELDKQRALSYLKIEKLLAPLWNKTLPLHNNEAELDVRGKVIKRKISLFNKSFKGVNAWDLYLGLSKSCKKLKVNFYKKVLSTFNKVNNPSLASLVYST
jgi:Transposase IS66 family